MSDGLVDLHIHSRFSCDADLAPDEIVAFAAAHGFRAISIADHDTVAAYPAAVREGEALSVEVIPSMEVTTLFDDREFHVLLPFVDCEAAGVDRIVPIWSREAAGEAAVDVTDQLVAEYKPSEKTLRTIAELRKDPPIIGPIHCD